MSRTESTSSQTSRPEPMSGPTPVKKKYLTLSVR
jgi:hypothetical protein